MLCCLKEKMRSMLFIFWCSMMIHQIISASLSPNTQSDDVCEALRVLFSPWTWVTGTSEESVRRWFSNEFHTDTICTYNSGRTALYSLLYAYNIGKGDEVIVQAFTCVAVPNSVLWAGATPVYADIDDSYNVDPTDIEKKITPKTRAIVLQHTFGIPAQIEKVIAIAKKYKLLIIEDCAHALGSVYKGKRLGSFGNAAFFSFGRDKAVSSVWGGVALIHNPTASQQKKLYEFQKKAPMPRMGWVVQQLLHPISFALILPLYRFGIGKVILVGLQKCALLSYPVYPEEKHGVRPSDFPAKYPNALAQLLVKQLGKLDTFASIRMDVARRYKKELPTSLFRTIPDRITGAAYLRYPILVNDPTSMIQRAKARGILLGNWYRNIIDPLGVRYHRVQYVLGSCPKAEHVSAHIINVPTLLRKRDVERVIAFFSTGG